MTETQFRQRLILILISTWGDGENMNIEELARCTTEELLNVLENSINLIKPKAMML